MAENQVILFAKRPEGWVDESCFELRDLPMPEPGEGEILIRLFYHSLDPYMRPRMTETDSYVERFEVGQPIDGGGMGEVVASNNPAFAVGDVVFGMLQWTRYQVHNGEGLNKVERGGPPLKDFLGVLGFASLTAYVGMKNICAPKEGETLFVSAAAGAVGSIAVQMGKIMGARVVGSGGSDEKVAWIRDTLGADAAFNYKTVSSIGDALDEHCPEGIDCNFENVGGQTLQAVLDRMNHFGRIAMCGTISEYNEEGPGLQHIFRVVNHRIRMEGFIVSDHMDMMPDFLTDMGAWMADGKIHYREDIVEGFETMPRALIGLFKGENQGKLIAQIGHEPN